MTIAELKEYLFNFDDEDIVSVLMWNGKDVRFSLNIPCCKPIKFKTKDTKENVAVIGVFDYCKRDIIED